MSDPRTPARVETGPLAFGDDWPGIFLRGDAALAFAQELPSDEVLDRIRDAPPDILASVLGLDSRDPSVAVHLFLGRLRELRTTLEACRDESTLTYNPGRPAPALVQQLRPFAECLPGDELGSHLLPSQRAALDRAGVPSEGKDGAPVSDGWRVVWLAERYLERKQPLKDASDSNPWAIKTWVESRAGAGVDPVTRAIILALCDALIAERAR